MKLAVTIQEASEMTGLSRSTLYKLFNTGKLKPRKAGARTLILFSDLESLLASLPSTALTKGFRERATQ